ncbi:MAG: ATP phosphoribosyltransferase [Candidatus Roizmanbacteria bacterium GW2011_GWA2_37_7]|uniref:ATP phosphoribosyltransferase n=1 Tax=Candidatus Roizmanbacteria bacterium GW2011_GWA2_37_7 TaxID=1618481 RepID=A0A0G0H9H3_9BACT|nr:MAG: ATP phosphoribosyltransferase [Candidatus Roizmanbacteria bacterium GW2011_GWA2_37_7]
MKTDFNNNNLKLAIQKKGRLTDDTILFLENAGLILDTDGQRLFAKCRNYPLDIVFVRDDDIPDFVENSTVDIGIVGENILYEKNSRVQKMLLLNFGYCRLVIAVQKDLPISNIGDLNKSKITTSYPRSVQRFFNSQNIPVDILEVKGSVELSPALGISSVVADLTSTGSTLAICDLRIIETIFESQAVLISRTNINNRRQGLIDSLIFRFKAFLEAQKYKYVMINAPEEKLEQITKIVHGLKSPTVTPLAIKGWISIQTAIQENVFWEKIEKIKEIGASGIIALPIEKLII